MHRPCEDILHYQLVTYNRYLCRVYFTFDWFHMHRPCDRFMSRLFNLGILYKWWGRWDVSNLVSRQVALADRMVILTRSVLIS